MQPLANQKHQVKSRVTGHAQMENKPTEQQDHWPGGFSTVYVLESISGYLHGTLAVADQKIFFEAAICKIHLKF